MAETARPATAPDIHVPEIHVPEIHVPEIHVAVATDRNYLPWCATAVRSCVRATRPRQAAVHVLHERESLNNEDRRALEAVTTAEGGSVDFHCLDGAKLAGLPSKGPQLGDRISWGRLLLPDLLPSVQRIVYLDSDTLVRESLSELWETTLGENPVAAVANVIEPIMRPYVLSLGLETFTDYFNAGVLVMDLDQMRAESTLDRVTRYVRARTQDLVWFDQDALNVAFAGRWHRLHPRWNAMNSFWTWAQWAIETHGAQNVDEAKARPAILHFEGPEICKPWHYLSDHPFRKDYRRELASTPWRSSAPVGRTTSTRLIHLLPRRARVPAYLRLQQAGSTPRRATLS